MTYLNLLVTQIGPICVLSILNCMVYKELKRSTTLQQQNNQTTNFLVTSQNIHNQNGIAGPTPSIVTQSGVEALTKRNIRLTRISIVIVMVFIICHVPRMIPNIAEMAGVDTANYDVFTVILSINHLLLTISSTVNYIIYFILCGRRQQSSDTTTLGNYI